MAAGTEEQLAWEARQRPRSAVYAVGAALLTMGTAIFTQILFADAPRAGYVDALANLTRPGPVDDHESLRTATWQYYDDNNTTIVGVSVLRALGTLALGLALGFLARATHFRREELPRFGLYVPVVGGGLLAIATVMQAVGIGIGVDDYLSGPHTVARADEPPQSSLVISSQLIQLVGTVALAVAFVLVCLNAMRAGLLTRFMGILGILVGVLVIFPIGSPVPIVQSFWLFALGLLYAGYWPAGVPPAWRTGRAEPWPSQQEIREQRQQAMARRRGEAKPEAAGPEPAPEPVAAPAPAGKPHPVSRKKKRKRRH